MQEKDILYITLGLLSLKVITKLLKKIIKQARPNGLEGGMPSYIGAMTIYLATYIILTSKCNFKCILSIFLFIIGTQGMKYFMMEHSLSQLFYGGLIGFAFALLLVKLNIYLNKSTF